MSEQVERQGIPPFPSSYRASGVLLHVSSLPSPYGIGDVGPAARAWIDRLHEAGQGWWQALPLGPTGYGNSPYQSLSSFAGNELLISPQDLIEEGLLGVGECEGTVVSGSVGRLRRGHPVQRRAAAVRLDKLQRRCARRPAGRF